MILNTSILKQILVALGGDPDYGDNSVDTERKIVNVVGGDGSKYNEGEAQLLKRWLDAIGGTSVYADNEDRTLGKILEQYGGGLGVFLNPTGKLEAILGQLNGVPPVAPTLVSATIETDGETLTLVFSQAMNGTLGFIESTETYGVSYVSGEGTNTYTLSIGPTVPSSESLTLNYTPGDFVSAENGEPLAVFALFPVTNSSEWDVDALAFFDRASISDGTQKGAVNTLVLDLKAENLWSKIIALYPFVGGAATPHSKNLKADQYNITWVNGPTHDANGVTGDGVAAYGDLGATADDLGTINSLHGSVYCRTATPTAQSRLFGAVTTTPSRGDFDIFTDTGDIGGLICAATGMAVDSNSSLGLCTITRTGATETRLDRAGEASTGTDSSVIIPNLTNVCLLSRSFEGFSNDHFSDANLSFASFGTGLSAPEIASLNTIIQTFQTTLGRNV